MENSIKCICWGCLGSSVVKNLPANTGDTGLRRQGNSACGPQLLSLCSRAWEPQLLSPCTTTTEAYVPQNLVFCSQRSHHHHHEKPAQVPLESSPCLLQLEKSPCSNEDPAQPKQINNNNKNLFWFPDKLQAWVLENFLPVAIQQFSPATLFIILQRKLPGLCCYIFNFCCYIQTRFICMEPIQSLVSMLIVNLHCN